MLKKSLLPAILFLGLLVLSPVKGECDAVVRTFDFFADQFDDQQTVWVRFVYYKKLSDHYRIIAYSPDKITIVDGRYEVAIPSRYYRKDNYLEIVFDAGFVTPRISLYPLSDYIPQTIYILLGALFIAVVSRNRFNRWTQKNVGKYAFPPRSFTTWPRFVRSALLYILVIECFYFVIIYSPGTVVFIDKYLGAGHIDYGVLKEMGQYSVLWSIFLLTGVLPNFPWVNKWETGLRDMLHDYAFIPSAAKAVISQLDINYTAFKPDDKIIQRILPKIGADRFDRHDFHNVSGEIAHKWCKLSYLKYRLEDWVTYPIINKFFEMSTNNYKRFLADYLRIKSEIDEYFDYIRQHDTGQETPHNGLLKATEIKLNAELNVHLNKAYNFICIGILGTEKMPRGRKRAFKFFGLAPFIPERSFIDWDTNIKTIGVLVMAILLPTLFYHILSQSGLLSEKLNYFPHSPRQALLWSLMGIGMHAVTLIVVVFFDRWRTRVLTSMYDEEKVSDTSLPHKLSTDVIAAMLGFLVGFAAMTALIASRYYGDMTKMAEVLAGSLSKNALWALLPAVTGFFVQYYLHTSLSRRRKGWQLGLLQGLVMSAVAALVTFMATDLGFSQIRHFMLYASFTSFFVGAGIGYVFPHSYRKKIEKSTVLEERRKSVRASVFEPATITVDDSRYACNIVNISRDGAKIDRALRFPGGSQVRINTTGFGQLDSIIVRKEKRGTCVTFPYLDASTENRIAAFIDRQAA